MDYKVVYSSQTGNTEKLAMAIFKALPDCSKDIQSIEAVTSEKASTYFVGFWNNRGSCGSDIMEFLSGLHHARVALFGTTGMSGEEDYFKQISGRVSAFIPDDNQYLGAFMCEGKLPVGVLEKYKQIRDIQDTPQIRAMIQEYEHAMLHPDERDLKQAADFVKQVLNMEKREEGA